MHPALLWALGSAAGAAIKYAINAMSEPQPDLLVGVGWVGSAKVKAPRVVVQRLMHNRLCDANDFRRVKSSEHCDEYFRGDESITAMPPPRRITWGDVPVFLTARYGLEGETTTVEMHFLASPSVTFDRTCCEVFAEHAEREFSGLLEALQEASNGRSRSDYASEPSDADYALFGLVRGATWEQVQAAYRDACLKYHPDRFAGQNVPQHLVDLAVRQFKEITAAYQTLKRRLAA